MDDYLETSIAKELETIHENLAFTSPATEHVSPSTSVNSVDEENSPDINLKNIMNLSDATKRMSNDFIKEETTADTNSNSYHLPSLSPKDSMKKFNAVRMNMALKAKKAAAETKESVLNENSFVEGERRKNMTEKLIAAKRKNHMLLKQRTEVMKIMKTIKKLKEKEFNLRCAYTKLKCSLMVYKSKKERFEKQKKRFEKRYKFLFSNATETETDVSEKQEEYLLKQLLSQKSQLEKGRVPPEDGAAFLNETKKRLKEMMEKPPTPSVTTRDCNSSGSNCLFPKNHKNEESMSTAILELEKELKESESLNDTLGLDKILLQENIFENFCEDSSSSENDSDNSASNEPMYHIHLIESDTSVSNGPSYHIDLVDSIKKLTESVGDIEISSTSSPSIVEYMKKSTQERSSSEEVSPDLFSDETFPLVTEDIFDSFPDQERDSRLLERPKNPVNVFKSDAESKESLEWKSEEEEKIISTVESSKTSEILTIKTPKNVQDSDSKVLYDLLPQVLKSESSKIKAIEQVLNSVYARATMSPPQLRETQSGREFQTGENSNMIAGLSQLEIRARKTCSERGGVKNLKSENFMLVSSDFSDRKTTKVETNNNNIANEDTDNNAVVTTVTVGKKDKSTFEDKGSTSADNKVGNKSQSKPKKLKQTTLVSQVDTTSTNSKTTQRKFKPKKITLNDLVKDAPWEASSPVMEKSKCGILSKNGDSGTSRKVLKESTGKNNNNNHFTNDDNSGITTLSQKYFQVSPHLLLPYRRRSNNRGKINSTRNKDANNNPYLEKKHKLPVLAKKSSRFEKTKNNYNTRGTIKSNTNGRVSKLALFKQQKLELPRSPVPSHLKYGVFPKMNIKSHGYELPLVAAPKELIRTVPVKITSDNISHRNRIKK